MITASMITAEPVAAPPSGHASLLGLLMLAVIMYAAACMIGLVPGPRTLLRHVSGQDKSGHVSTAEGVDSADGAPGVMSGHDDGLLPEYPTEPGDAANFVRLRPSAGVAPAPLIPWGPQSDEALAANLAARRAEVEPPGSMTTAVNAVALAGAPGGEVPIKVRRPVSPRERHTWLKARSVPGDPIAAQCASQKELDAVAAVALGVDVRTIRRDRAHMARLAARR